MRLKQHRGFTLVELAIVMTIIGLLIGGILKGQELLENARVTATIAQVKSYDAAVTTFRNIYNGWPGDLRNAGSRLPGCTEGCTPFPDTAGDGFIGNAPHSGYADGQDSVAHQPEDRNVYDESWLIWLHLLKANLLSGVTDQAMSETMDRRFGVTDPATRLGGGFWAMTNAAGYRVESPGLTLVLDSMFRNISDFGYDAGEGYDEAAMMPARAAQIDRKMDDGRPQSGTIKALGNQGGYCDNSDNTYAETITKKDCSLMIAIQR